MNTTERLHSVISKTHPTQKGRCSMDSAPVGQKTKAVLWVVFLGALFGMAIGMLIHFSNDRYYHYEDSVIVVSLGILALGTIASVGAQFVLLWKKEHRYVALIQAIYVFLTSVILSTSLTLSTLGGYSILPGIVFSSFFLLAVFTFCAETQHASLMRSKMLTALGVSWIVAFVGLLVFSSYDELDFLIFSTMISVACILVLIGTQAVMLILNKCRYLKMIQVVHILISSSISGAWIVLFVKNMSAFNSLFYYSFLISFVSVFLVSVLIFCTIHRER